MCFIQRSRLKPLIRFPSCEVHSKLCAPRSCPEGPSSADDRELELHGVTVVHRRPGRASEPLAQLPTKATEAYFQLARELKYQARSGRWPWPVAGPGRCLSASCAATA